MVNALTKAKAIANLDHLVDVEVLLGSQTLSLLEAMHNLIKFSQMWDAID